MAKQDKVLINVLELVYSDKHCQFTLFYKEPETSKGFLGTIYTGEYKTIKRQVTGILSAGNTIFMNFADTGENVYEVLGNGLKDVIEAKIRLHIYDKEKH